ncbi:hypothetical protein CK203_032693 [Vitis vinifera]|uniref:Uncharacterized protein n=2 Tax=Vitis vinifera TaxID=29760 RepID=A0A438HXM2_VITVI|nr:hypothetical protein CK203_032693 [Vitis vinifera]
MWNIGGEGESGQRKETRCEASGHQAIYPSSLKIEGSKESSDSSIGDQLVHIDISSTFRGIEEASTRNEGERQQQNGRREVYGAPIHSQVMKIKQEMEKISHPSLQQPEVRRVLRDITRQRSRSPLGLADRPISVANS